MRDGSSFHVAALPTDFAFDSVSPRPDRICRVLILGGNPTFSINAIADLTGLSFSSVGAICSSIRLGREVDMGLMNQEAALNLIIGLEAAGFRVSLWREG